MKRTLQHVLPALAVLFATAVSTPQVHAQAHDQGFFMRLGLGLSAAGTSLTDSFGDELKLSGPGVDFDIALGYTIVENLAIHGNIFGWSLVDPNVEFDNVELGTDDTTLTFSAFGVGLTYYIMPANLYLSGTIGGGSLSLEVSDFSGELQSGTGLAGQVSIGKEWFVGDRWGLGAALGGTFHSIPDDSGLDADFSGASVGLRFSATLN